jgi:hypothetical protein
MTPFRCVASVLRAKELPLEALAALDPGAFVASARRHRVLPLVADALRGRPGVPAPLLDAVQREAHRQAAKDLLCEDELRRLLDRCAEAPIDVLLFKGAQLAYRVYPRPDFRARADSDLLIAPERRQDLHDLLTDLGYDLVPDLEGRHANYQATYVLRRQGLTIHEVDVHWRLVNREVFADLPSFDELWLSAEPLPGLTASARGLSPVHALLVACVHRVAHHFDSGALVWFYDIHLLAKAFGCDDWKGFVDAAGRASVASICLHGLTRTMGWFGTPVPDGVLVDLRRLAEHGEREASAEYLAPGRRPIHDIVSDLRALPTWSARSRLVSERLFPSARYMREVYARTSRAPLAWLYLLRALQGARKSLSRR